MEAFHLAIRNGMDAQNLILCLDSIGKHNINSHLDEIVDGQTALSQAVLSGNIDAAQLLIKSGASLNTPSKMWDEEKKVWRYESPLVTASRLGLLPIVILFLQSGAELDIPDNTLGKTPLNWACNRRHSKVAQTLIHFGARINQADYTAETPMTEAVGHRDLETVKLLINKGVFLDVHVNYDRDTALLFALLIGEVAMAVELIQAGANVNVINRNGEECLTCTIMSPTMRLQSSYLCRLLIAAGCKVNKGHLNKVRALGDIECEHILEDAFFHPATLSNIVCRCLRQILLRTSKNTNIKCYTDLLPLPFRIKQMIKLEIIK